MITQYVDRASNLLREDDDESNLKQILVDLCTQIYELMNEIQKLKNRVGESE